MPAGSVKRRDGIIGRYDSCGRRYSHYYKLKGDHLLINADIKHEIYSTFGENDILTIPRFVIVDRDGNITLCPQPLSENPDFTPLRTFLNQHLNP